MQIQACGLNPTRAQFNGRAANSTAPNSTDLFPFRRQNGGLGGEATVAVWPKDKRWCHFEIGRSALTLLFNHRRDPELALRAQTAGSPPPALEKQGQHLIRVMPCKSRRALSARIAGNSTDLLPIRLPAIPSVQRYRQFILATVARSRVASFACVPSLRRCKRCSSGHSFADGHFSAFG